MTQDLSTIPPNRLRTQRIALVLIGPVAFIWLTAVTFLRAQRVAFKDTGAAMARGWRGMLEIWRDGVE